MEKEYLLCTDNWNEINNEFGKTGGVYILFCRQDAVVKPVDRLLGTNEEGVLYIGKADFFLERVIDLKKSICPQWKSTAHDVGARYKASKEIEKKFPHSCLFGTLGLRTRFATLK